MNILKPIRYHDRGFYLVILTYVFQKYKITYFVKYNNIAI